MYTSSAEILSVLLIIAYLYKKTKDEIALWVSGYVLYLIVCIIGFRFIFPKVAFFSPTIEYMGFLAIVGLPFLALVVIIGVKIDKRRNMPDEVKKKNTERVFNLSSKDNIIFWTIILSINVLAALFDAMK